MSSTGLIINSKYVARRVTPVQREILLNFSTLLTDSRSVLQILEAEITKEF